MCRIWCLWHIVHVPVKPWTQNKEICIIPKSLLLSFCNPSLFSTLLVGNHWTGLRHYKLSSFSRILHKSNSKCSSDFSTQNNNLIFSKIYNFLPFTHYLLTRLWLSATIILLNRILLKITNGLLIAKHKSPYSVHSTRLLHSTWSLITLF